MDNIDKVPPHNLDAERSVLGSMILDNNAIHKVTEILNSNSFYRKAHSIIFNAIIELDNNSKAVDLVTVSEKLKSKEQLDDIGGSGYITALANSVPTTQNVGQYANIVKEKYDLRKLIKIGDKIQNLGYQDDNSKDAIFKAEELVYNLTQSQKRGERHHIKDILLEIADSIERRLDGDIKTLETPFSDINNMLSAGGFEPQTLNIIMARPSMGKTAFMLNLASYWGIQQNKPLSIYSLETEKKLVVQRMLSIHNGVPLSGFKRPELLDDE
ncbi:MAG: replicative DNA helicase, partial [bacterium]